MQQKKKTIFSLFCYLDRSYRGVNVVVTEEDDADGCEEVDRKEHDDERSICGISAVPIHATRRHRTWLVERDHGPS